MGEILEQCDWKTAWNISKQHRAIFIREAARIQSFPKNTVLSSQEQSSLYK